VVSGKNEDHPRVPTEFKAAVWLRYKPLSIAFGNCLFKWRFAQFGWNRGCIFYAFIPLWMEAFYYFLNNLLEDDKYD